MGTITPADLLVSGHAGVSQEARQFLEVLLVGSSAGEMFRGKMLVQWRPRASRDPFVSTKPVVFRELGRNDSHISCWIPFPGGEILCEIKTSGRYCDLRVFAETLARRFN